MAMPMVQVGPVFMNVLLRVMFVPVDMCMLLAGEDHERDHNNPSSHRLSTGEGLPYPYDLNHQRSIDFQPSTSRFAARGPWATLLRLAKTYCA